MVIGVNSGKDALKAIESNCFDVVLSDLMMPGMDGIQMLREAPAIDPQLVGIIMTGQGTVLGILRRSFRFSLLSAHSPSR